MTAQRLRDAARGMREKAEGLSPTRGRLFYGEFQIVDAEDGEVLATFPDGGPEWDYFASVPPAVTLAVADLLDRTADYLPPDPHGEDEDCCCCIHARDALAVADAFLGTPRPPSSPSAPVRGE